MNLEETDQDQDWFSGYFCAVLSPRFLTWGAKNATHLYGPLLHRHDDYGVDWSISDVGRVLIVECYEFEQDLLRARPGVALQELIASIEAENPFVDHLKVDEGRWS